MICGNRFYPCSIELVIIIVTELKIIFCKIYCNPILKKILEDLNDTLILTPQFVIFTF